MGGPGPEQEVVLHEVDGGHRVVRVGDEVRRPMYPSAPAVHQLLRYLEGVAFDAAPRLIGVDGGVERLRYIEGQGGTAGWDGVRPDSGLAAAARLLRRYHDAVRSFSPPVDVEWSSGAKGPPRPGEVVLHGDPGPWNMIWVDGRPTALIDWDHANPGQPVDDLAYLAVYAAPLCPDREAVEWMGHSAAPDRRHRLEVLAEAYGAVPDGLIARAIAVMAKTNRTVERLAALGCEPHKSWVDKGLLSTLEARHRWIVDNGRRFTAAGP